MKKSSLGVALAYMFASNNLHPYLGDYTASYTSRTGKGRKRTTTTAQQKRDKIKRKNKGK